MSFLCFGWFFCHIALKYDSYKHEETLKNIIHLSHDSISYLRNIFYKVCII